MFYISTINKKAEPFYLNKMELCLKHITQWAILSFFLQEQGLLHLVKSLMVYVLIPDVALNVKNNNNNETEPFCHFH